MKIKKTISLILPLTTILLIATSCSSKKVKLEQLKPPSKGEEIVVMKTNYGDIKIRLFPKVAPKAVENFKTQIKRGYYDGKTFYRTKKDYFIQGGSNGDILRDSIWGKYYEDEFDKDYIHIRGSLCNANLGEPDTNGSAFFIVQNKKVEEDLVDTMNDLVDEGAYSKDIANAYKQLGGVPDYDMKYTVFGQVYEGMNTVDKIANVEVDESDKPKKEVVIESAKIEKYKEYKK
ncbi:peptidylprolyl isomerase [Anaeromicropila herbilytica]|uniref:Peptidyl-prolyl cis-trans isomerase n=1 Tax=Anaeromicropila herbilytica TaxID=2785025 RepID=A0A7R7EHK8_9FIRM|nr:peptidylprolyl isomerase [Anaeromicropila herbilytica]BCN28873.1 peptidyl-prolyl cis-trans isomerase [Anaeromicropila herbilytica]